MAHPDIAASMARSMSIEAKQKESAEPATTADEGADASGSEETSEESSSGEGGEDGADSSDGDGAGEGEEEGGDESGSQDTESDDTTAEEDDSESSAAEQASGEEGQTEDDESEEKPEAPKWDEEEQKAVKDWFGKDADKVKPDPVAKKLLKIARDNHAKVKELTQQGAVLNDHIAGLGELILNQDFEGLNAIAEELGGEKLPFDTRTHEDLMKEAAASYNAFFDTLEKGLKEKPEVWELVQKVLDPLYRKTEKAIADLEKKAVLKQAAEVGRKAAGKPVKGSVSKDLETKATQNFTDLKSKDPEAQARFDALKPFIQGGVLRDKNRIYSLNPQLADKLGKAVEFHANFDKKYLPKIRASVEKELKARGAIKAPPPGRKPEGSRPGGQAPAKSTKNFNHYAGPKILERLQR